MIAFWMLWSTWIGLLAVGVALLAERAGASWGVPRRAVWAVACALIAVVSIGGITLPRLWRSTPVGSMTVTDALTSARDTTRFAAGLTTGSAAGIDAEALRDAWMAWLSPLDDVLLALWIAGSTVLAAVAVVGVVRLRRARRTWRTEQVDGVEVLVSERTGPAIIGVRATSIVVPQWVLAYDAPLRAIVVGHEREHVDARDPLLLALVRVAAVLLPWNLALWWSLRRLRLAVEMDCDARVLRALPDRRRYGLLLVAVAQARARFAETPLAPVVGFMRRSEVAKRVKVISAAPHGGRLRAISLATAALVGGFAIACDTPGPVVPGGNLTMNGLAFRNGGMMLTKADVVAWLRANGELSIDTNSVEGFDEGAIRRMYGVTRLPELLTDDRVIVDAIRQQLATDAPGERLTGRVRLEADIDESGRITRLEAVDPPPMPDGVDAMVALTTDVPARVLAVENRGEGSKASPALKRAAVRAILPLARFRPGELDGRPAPVRALTMTYDFD